jgi:enoyl-CoA hydratase/carnithine racemase
MVEVNKYRDLEIENRGQVATIRLVPPLKAIRSGKAPDVHWELGAALSELRGDNHVRVIILTGADPDEFLVPPTTDVYSSDASKKVRSDPVWMWKTFTGILRTHQTMAEIEKPIVARVNGDAIGFGQSLMFASDIIVAREDARIADMHMGMAEVEPFGPPFGIVPGDGGTALVPLYMTPAKAKEYLMLAKAYSARELAQLGIINYAVPLAQLDSLVEEIVGRLLKRSAYALAWTKRVANRRLVHQLNLTLDAGAAYEMVNFLQAARLGGEDKKLGGTSCTAGEA